MNDIARIHITGTVSISGVLSSVSGSHISRISLTVNSDEYEIIAHKELASVLAGFRKGSYIQVDGDLKISSWYGRDNDKRWIAQIEATELKEIPWQNEKV